jgi:hypothetical protein
MDARISPAFPNAQICQNSHAPSEPMLGEGGVGGGGGIRRERLLDSGDLILPQRSRRKLKRWGGTGGLMYGYKVVLKEPRIMN